eukprot:GHVU01029283.1.p2 GENE.GHVU01029283.1~~GHVU01029283.1.p2  ORF type:complete len:374 (-),score=64.75 GHVU01029283.1:692-1813(-)
MIDLESMAIRFLVQLRQKGVAISLLEAAYLLCTLVASSEEGYTFNVERRLLEADAQVHVEAAVETLERLPELAGVLLFLARRARVSSEAADREAAATESKWKVVDAKLRKLNEMKRSEFLNFEKVLEVHELVAEYCMIKCAPVFQGIQSDWRKGPSVEERSFGKDEKALWVKELKGILNSLFPRSAVRQLMALSQPERAQNLEKIATMCMGVRLLYVNTNNASAAARVPSLDSLSRQLRLDSLVQRTEDLTDKLNLHREGLERRLRKLLSSSSAGEAGTATDSAPSPGGTVKRREGRSATEEEQVVLVKHRLSAVYAASQHINEISEEIEQQAGLMGSLCEEFNTKMEALTDAVDGEHFAARKDLVRILLVVI